MKWYTLFKQHILDRGFEYYEDGYVLDFKYTDKEITAQVDGSEIYDVCIQLAEDDILHMSCSCPYAGEGHNCKHMAAVLFAYDALCADEEGDDIESFEDAIGIDDLLSEDYCHRAVAIETVRKEKEEVANLVAKIPEEKVRELLVEFVLADDSLKNKLQMQYAFEMDEKLMEDLKQELGQIIVKYGRNGYVDWYHAFDFTTELENFLDTKVKLLIEKNCLKAAFELTNEVFHEIGTVDIDDSDGGLSLVAGNCYECWKQIAEKSNKVFKTEMQKWFERHKKGYVYDFLEEYIEEILLDVFATEEMLKTEMKNLDTLINKTVGTDCGRIYFTHYGAENPILKRMEYMKRLHYTDEEIYAYRQKNRRFFIIREMEVTEAIARKDYETAISVLLESRELDAEHQMQLKKYSEQLIDIYKTINDTDAYCKELRRYLKTFRQRDLTYVKMLKAVISDAVQWNSVVDEIVQYNWDENFVCRLLYSEQRYEQLMCAIEKSANKVSMLDDYEKVLRKRMPERVINIYMEYLEYASKIANDRARYRQLMDYLKKIKKCSGGEAAAKSIADAWKQDYKRRTAMMDELRKAGF